MVKLTLKKFMKLSREDQNRRYKELSANDKFMARLCDGSSKNYKSKKKI